jgi:recombination protein RecT
MSGAITPMSQFRTDIQKMKPEFAMALPRGYDADRMARMCLTVVQQNKDLLDCTRQSLLGAMMTAAQLGLYPDVSVLGHAYFLPFRVHGTKTVTFVAGYKGLIDLARRSGHVTSIMAYPVHDGDKFEFAYGTDPFIKHVPSGEPIDGRELTHVYAMAKLRGESQRQFVVMTREEVEAIRKRSPARNRGPWVEHYEQMALKTVIRRLCKYLPLSSDLQRAVALDEAADSGVDQKLDTMVDTDRLDAMGDDIVEGEIIEDEVTSADALTELMSDIGDKDGPSPYEQLCIQGMEVFGDKEWAKKLAAEKKKIADAGLEPEEAKEKLMDALSVIIRKGG